MSGLDEKTVEQAVKALSRGNKFWFTRRCLMFELLRKNAWRDPGTDLEGCERDFAEALAEHERRVGQLARLVRPETAVAGMDPADLQGGALPSDLFDYSVQRVALFQRMDLCLMLIANGFHREIELALTVPPEFPTHIWARIRAQLDAGLRTTFLAVHDCGASSEEWLAAIEDEFGAHEHAEVARVGLTVPWAFRLRLPVRGPAPDGRNAPPISPDKPFEPMLRSGSYALLEELTPLRAMRWIYGRVAKGAEDVGFG
jgi:hypothetical protein